MIHRTRMAALLATMLLALAWSGPAAAQSLDGGLPLDEELRATPIWGPRGVIVVLSGFSMSGLDPAAGFHVYRDEGRGFRRITDRGGLRALGDEQEMIRVIGRRRIERLVRQLDLDPARGQEELFRAFRQREEQLFVWATLDPALMEALGVLYRDEEARDAGATVRYLATVIGADGREERRGIAGEVQVGVPAMPLRSPRITDIELRQNSARIRWEADPEDRASLGFNVYRGPDAEGPWQKLNGSLLLLMSVGGGLPTAGSFTDSTLSMDRAWHYRVTGQDFAGNESAPAEAPPVLPVDTQAPAQPVGVRVDTAAEGILLVWPSEALADLAGYRVERRTKDSLVEDFSSLTESLLAPAGQDSNRFVDRSAQPGRTYEYRLQAFDAAGNASPYTVAFDGLFRSTAPLLPPGNLRAGAAGRAIRLDWEPGPSGSATDLAGYHIFRSLSIGGDKAQVSHLIDPDTLFFVDEDAALSPEGSYWYTVRSVNFEGVMSADSRPVAASPEGVILPDPPTQVRITQAEHALRLFWGGLGDRRIAGFHVERMVRDGAGPGPWQRLTTEALSREQTNYRDAGAAPGVDYSYRILSVDREGNPGPPSAVMDGRVFVPAPPAPGNLRIHAEAGALVLQWDPLIGVEGTLTRVYRRREDQAESRLLDSVPFGESRFRDTDVQGGVRYLYSLRSLSAGGKEGEGSAEVDYRLRN